MRSFATVLGMALAFVCASCGAAGADPLKAGDSLNYQYTFAITEPVNPNAPAEVLKQSHPHTGTNTFTFSVVVDRLNPDGSAHAMISPHYTVHVPGWTFVDFEGTVLPDGQIVPTYDVAALKGSGLDTGTSVRPGYRPRTPPEQLAFSAHSFNRRISLFNDVALGAGKHKTFKDGDAWRIVIPDKDNETINFSYVRTESYHGHDVAVLALSLIRTTAEGPRPVKGTAYYDPQKNLLVGLHYEGDDDATIGVRFQAIDVSIQP